MWFDVYFWFAFFVIATRNKYKHKKFYFMSGIYINNNISYNELFTNIYVVMLCLLFCIYDVMLCLLFCIYDVMLCLFFAFMLLCYVYFLNLCCYAMFFLLYCRMYSHASLSSELPEIRDSSGWCRCWYCITELLQNDNSRCCFKFSWRISKNIYLL